jgi:cardiolipin synthase
MLLLIYGGIALRSLQRRRRRFKFPHRLLDEVQVEANHRLKIYNYGSYTFKDMLHDIDSAKESIYLETYIFKGDAIGREFKRRLVAKAKEGVKIYIAFDGFGSLFMPLGFRRWPKECIINWYGPLYTYLNFLWLGTYIRDHRKILIIDNKIGYLGGMNIGREYATTWRDTHLRMEGPTVEELALAFAELWNKYNHGPKRRLELPFKPNPDDDHILWLRESRPSPIFGSIAAQKTIRDTYLEAFDASQKYMLITNPYFLPDTQMEISLMQAIRRGVRVEIIIPERTNHLIVDLLSRPLLHRIIEAGGHIWLYRKTVIHSKTATIDGSWSTVGSANLDGRSLINHEINLFVNNPDFAQKMEEMFRDDLANCRRAELGEFSNPGFFRRSLELLLAPLRPFV